jgi:hypothetical protein
MSHLEEKHMKRSARVTGKDRDEERDRARARSRDRDIGRDKGRRTDKDTNTHRDNERGKEKDRNRDRDRERSNERNRDRVRQDRLCHVDDHFHPSLEPERERARAGGSGKCMQQEGRRWR